MGWNLANKTNTGYFLQDRKTIDIYLFIDSFDILSIVLFYFLFISSDIFYFISDYFRFIQRSPYSNGVNWPYQTQKSCTPHSGLSISFLE